MQKKKAHYTIYGLSYNQTVFIAETIQVTPYLSWTQPLMLRSSGGGFSTISAMIVPLLDNSLKKLFWQKLLQVDVPELKCCHFFQWALDNRHQ